MGALVPNYGSAGGAAQSSFGLAAAGGGLGAVGDLFSGIGGFQQASFQSAIAQNNAAIARANAGAALQAGSYEESAKKLQTGQAIGAERAAQGANGVDVNVGSAAAVRQSTATVGAMDAAMIHYNAARAAYGQEVEASSLEAQSKMDQRAAQGALEGGLFKAGSSLLATSTNLSSRYAGWQLQAGT